MTDNICETCKNADSCRLPHQQLVVECEEYSDHDERFPFELREIDTKLMVKSCLFKQDDHYHFTERYSIGG